jgi:hypothetical protein
MPVACLAPQPRKRQRFDDQAEATPSSGSERRFGPITTPSCSTQLDDQFQGMPAEGAGWAAAEATARRSGGGLPALVVEVAAGSQASGSTSGCVNRTGLPSDRA